MNKQTFDAAIIGGGIAGASIAAFLAQQGVKAAIFEKEQSLAYHTTGRSAALLTPNYGPASMRAFASIAVEFFENPPAESESPLIFPKSAVSVLRKEDVFNIDRPPNSQWWNLGRCLQNIPFLRENLFIGAFVDINVASIDVHALHSLYIKQFTNRGGQIYRNTPVTNLEKKPDVWELTSSNSKFEAKVVVNAAGAWGDHVATLAKLSPVSLTPKRRTVIVLRDDQFENVNFDALPFVVVEPNYLYFQNFGRGQLMISPVDQTPSIACDAQPDDLDIAITVSRFEEVTNLKVKRIDHSWAGLRTFAADSDPVIGWEPYEDGFFWLTGQGGYGIFSSPGIGQYAAALITESELPKPFLESSYNFELLSPKRFRLTANF